TVGRVVTCSTANTCCAVPVFQSITERGVPNVISRSKAPVDSGTAPTVKRDDNSSRSLCFASPDLPFVITSLFLLWSEEGDREGPAEDPGPGTCFFDPAAGVTAGVYSVISPRSEAILL